MASQRYSRNEALFGAAGQAKISEARVAIVGLGGLGSHVAQQLAYLGVTGYVLVDFDGVTASSMNRLVGAIAGDVAAQTKKISVAERMITAVRTRAAIESVDGRVADAVTEAAVASADVVFGCLDRDLHRVELTELCARHAKPYFDLASDTEGTGDELVYGGRVIFCNGSRCLVCLPEILNQDEITGDRMSPQDRETKQILYGVDRDTLSGTGPSVVSVNGVVASLAVTEFMVYVTGLREPASQLTYRGEKGIVRKSNDEPTPDCYYCTRLWGTGPRMSS